MTRVEGASVASAHSSFHCITAKSISLPKLAMDDISATVPLCEIVRASTPLSLEQTMDITPEISHNGDSDSDRDQSGSGCISRSIASGTVNSIVAMRVRGGGQREFKVNWRSSYVPKHHVAHFLQRHRGRVTRTKRGTGRGSSSSQGAKRWRIQWAPSWEPLENLPAEAVCEYYERHWTGGC